MLRQCKTTINFNTPVKGRDLQDSDLFMSDKHWVIAEVLVCDSEAALFIDYNQEVVAQWPTKSIVSISIPTLDPNSPVILAQKSADYQAQVKAQRSAAWSKWTPTQESELKRLVEEGYNYEEIADIFQRTPRAIYDRLCKLGMYPDSHPGLGSRPEKRHYQRIDWPTRAPLNGDAVTVCLGCGQLIYARPCLCWARNDTSFLATWREHNHKYNIYGSRIYEKGEA